MGGFGSGMDRETTLLDPLGQAARENATRPYLTIFRAGSAAVFQFPHDGTYVIGRATDAAVMVDEQQVSRRHAEHEGGGDDGHEPHARMSRPTFREHAPLLR